MQFKSAVIDFFKTLKNKGSVIYLIAMVSLFSCNSDSENVPDDPIDSVVKSVSEGGPIKAPESVTARDAGISIKVGNKILWLFADTLFSPASVGGINGHANTAAIAPVDDATETTEPTDANGASYQAIPFTDDEISHLK